MTTLLALAGVALLITAAGMIADYRSWRRTGRF